MGALKRAPVVMRARLGGSASAATLGEPCAAGGGVYSPRRGARGKEEPAAESSVRHGAVSSFPARVRCVLHVGGLGDRVVLGVT
jgi:hypothetical protein